MCLTDHLFPHQIVLRPSSFSIRFENVYARNQKDGCTKKIILIKNWYLSRECCRLLLLPSLSFASSPILGPNNRIHIYILVKILDIVIGRAFLSTLLIICLRKRIRIRIKKRIQKSSGPGTIQMKRPLQKSHAKIEIEIRNTRRMLDVRGDSVWSTGNAKMNDICMIFDLDEQLSEIYLSIC